jgi:hydrogenase assembly chaperone HypC/HupF
VCLGIPGEVVSMVEGYGDQLALVDVQGVSRRVNVGMLEEPPAAGQWVLIHMGFALQLTDRDGADAAMSGLELIGRPRADDAQAGTEAAS